MLTDAIAAEGYKFRRNHSVLFWGFAFVPLAVLVFNLTLETYLGLHNSGVVAVGGRAGEIPLGEQVLHGIGLAGSSFAQIFFVAGAAAIFAGEYRWETWRLLTPRNSRINLLAAKFAVYAMACAASLAGLGLGALLQTVYGAVLNGMTMAMPPAAFGGQLLGLFLATWAELLVVGVFTAAIAVAGRAMTGALLAGIFFSFAQGIAIAIVHPWEAPLRYFAMLPAMCAYLLRAWASGQQIAPGVFADPALLLPASGFLLLWIAAGAAVAAALFQAQDLPRE